MQRLVALALVWIGITIPVCAQRGGGHGGGGSSHGGFSGHAGGSFRGGGFSSSRPSRGGMSSQYSGNRGGAIRQGRPGFALRPPTGYGGRSSNFANGQFRRPFRPPYRSPYRGAYGYGYGIFPGLGWGGYSGDGWYDDSSEDSGATSDPNDGYVGYDGYDAQSDQNVPPYPESGYGTPYDPNVPNVPSAPPLKESAITVVFKDGRAPLQVHNYILSRTTLSVLDAQHREIPVADIDLAATQKANFDAGVSFQLPATGK